MKTYLCAECGYRIYPYLKAVQGHVIGIITPHKCSKEPQEFSLEPMEIPIHREEGKFVQNLDNLRPEPKPFEDLRDRRPNEQVKTSTAPESVLDSIQHAQPSTPANSNFSEPEEV